MRPVEPSERSERMLYAPTPGEDVWVTKSLREPRSNMEQWGISALLPSRGIGKLGRLQAKFGREVPCACTQTQTSLPNHAIINKKYFSPGNLEGTYVLEENIFYQWLRRCDGCVGTHTPGV
jgi:hypothetical protein